MHAAAARKNATQAGESYSADVTMLAVCGFAVTAVLCFVAAAWRRRKAPHAYTEQDGDEAAGLTQHGGHYVQMGPAAADVKAVDIDV